MQVNESDNQGGGGQLMSWRAMLQALEVIQGTRRHNLEADWVKQDEQQGRENT